MSWFKRTFSGGKKDDAASNPESIKKESDQGNDNENKDFPDMPDFRAMNAAICFSAGFKPVSSLPFEWERNLRPALEIAGRLNAIKSLVLWLMVPSDDLPNDKILTFVTQNELDNFLTEEEIAILNSSRDDVNSRNSIGWKFENAWSLAWFFGYAEPEFTGQMMSGV